MKRLVKKSQVSKIKEFIEKYIGKGQECTLDEFYKAFIKDYKDKIKEYPLLNSECQDLDYCGGEALGLLSQIFYGNLVYELDGGGDADEVYENLIEVDIHDFWLDINNIYKKEVV